MKFRIRFADQIVGAFVIIAIGFIAVALIFIGVNQRWYAKNYVYRSQFPTGGGLSQGMPISFKGFTIGKVQSVTLNDQNTVDIIFIIEDRYIEKVKPNSILELAVSPIGLGGGLLFHPGKNDEPHLEEFKFIPILKSNEGRHLVAQGLVDIPKRDDTVNEIIENIKPIMDNVNTLLVTTNDSIRTVDSLLQNIEDTIVIVNKTLEGNQPGPVKDIIDTVDSTLVNVTDQANEILDILVAELEGITANVNGITENIAKTTANIEQTTAAIADPTGIVKKLLDPKGSIATILDDDNVLFGQIEEMLKKVDGIIGDVKEFSDFISGTTPQISGILEEGQNALDQGQDVLEGLKNNPLLSGGITEQKEQQTTFQSYRDEDF